MYDSIMCDTLIENNWIQPIAETDIQDKEDILPFALEGFFRDGKLYGIPVFLCGNFLIYDENCENLASAEHLTDLAGERKILVAATEDPMNKPQYYLEAVADIQGTPHPSDQPNQDAEQMVALLNQLAIEEYKAADFDQVPVIYDGGTGKGYLGYSESMRLLKARSSHTGIKQISFSEKENMPRLYADAVAVTSGVQGQRFEKCLELMNLISSAQTLQDLSVVDGRPQYLMLARKSLYDTLSARFPLYSTLKELAFDERNSVITH
jgi:thiamine pyridinylase